MKNMILRLILMFVSLLASSFLSAATTEAVIEQLQQAESRKDLIHAVEMAVETNDATLLPVLQAMQNNELKRSSDGHLLIGNENGTLTDALSGESVAATETDDLPRANNLVRRHLAPAIAQLQLVSPDPSIRLEAAQALNKRPPDGAGKILQKAIERETEPGIKHLLQSTLAQIDLQGDDKARRLEAINILSDIGLMEFREPLLKLLAQQADGSPVESDEEIRAAAQSALKEIDRIQRRIAIMGNLFYGLSLGCVLLLAALGLAITFGLMGVINMAHGEMLMLGAYSTYVVQNLFKDYLPDFFDAYLIVAIPVAFIVTALMGVILERLLIRHLYNRPLETLLATWGIGLILIQSIRALFGAQNVEVANPTWLSGGIEVASGLVLSYNRLAIMAFVVLVVMLVWLILYRTSLGLQVRAVTQNRKMAACMGIRTAWVDMWTFGFGSGVAGLGGVALSQITNVGPELGQAYIVDSFMVVVLGGVGNIAGAITGAFSLGILNKFLEPEFGAVLAKIMVLVFLILFIQKRPQGIFALKGRFVED